MLARKARLISTLVAGAGFGITMVLWEVATRGRGTYVASEGWWVSLLVGGGLFAALWWVLGPTPRRRRR